MIKGNFSILGGFEMKEQIENTIETVQNEIKKHELLSLKNPNKKEKLDPLIQGLKDDVERLQNLLNIAL